MIKAYAKQMNPAYQESPLYIFDEYPENLIVYGNRDYKSHTIPVFDCLMDHYEDHYGSLQRAGRLRGQL